MSTLRRNAGIGLWLTFAALANSDELVVPGLQQTLASSLLLRQTTRWYDNYAIDLYANYHNHSSPYAETRRAFYGPTGDYLATGYDLFSWSETRRPEQLYGSAIFTDMHRFRGLLEHAVTVRDGYGGWGYSAIVGDGLAARFTPLTLSKADMSGVRFDLSTPLLHATVLGSRIERPRYFWDGGLLPVWSVEDTDFADTSALLLGTRVQGHLGALQFGLNGVNLHVYQSTQSGNTMKGVLRPEQAPVDWVVVRVTDDSPKVSGAGATVQEMRLVVNGQRRTELIPSVVRHRDDAPISVGSVSRSTGDFTPIIYNTYRGYYQSAPSFYRGRSEVPLYADYFYRLDHDRGLDVASNTDLEKLLATFQVASPQEVIHVRGEEHVIFLFDVTGEPTVEAVEVEAVLGNDFRVDVATLVLENPRGRNYAAQYRSSFYRTALRAEGRVEDMSNLGRRRFAVGENTALFTYSADLGLAVAGSELKGEYARSALYSRYPAKVQGAADFNRGERSQQRGGAYFLNAIRWFGREQGLVGAELFSMEPDYATEMRAFVPFELGLTSGHLAALVNQTVYWDLVQDNEDGDRYPDIRMGNVLGSPRDRLDRDSDGVFIGQDGDHDGIPDTNRNFNEIPDYEEPFLMWDVEPNEYTYGLDRNNNDEPDLREDDADPDYPYDADQRGFHLFAQVNLTPHWSVGAGRYDIGEIAGAGQNRASYGVLSYRREGADRWRRAHLESQIRRVEDDIADEYAVTDQTAQSIQLSTRGRSLRRDAPSFGYSFRDDPLFYQDSYVNETYFETWLRPWAGFDLVQKIRLRLNWQKGGRLHNGGFQKKRRLDLWNVVSRAEYRWQLGRLRVQPQLKVMLLRLDDRNARQPLRNEYRVIPILRLLYPVMPRTVLRFGLQGVGPFPYRVEDDAQPRNSFEQRVAFLTLTNRSAYFGYNLFTILGIQHDEKSFADPFQNLGNRDSWSLFVRGLIGFTEHGPLL